MTVITATANRLVIDQLRGRNGPLWEQIGSVGWTPAVIGVTMNSSSESAKTSVPPDRIAVAASLA